METTRSVQRIRIWLAVFIVGLVLSGLTAFPLQNELQFSVQILQSPTLHSLAVSTHLLPWLERVSDALTATDKLYPFLAYGTDWLAFSHLVIAIAFIGPWMNPVQNKWVITVGLIACGGVIPLALIAGAIRGIPLPWQLVDCSFGVFGSIPLLFCWRMINSMEKSHIDLLRQH